MKEINKSLLLFLFSIPAVVISILIFIYLINHRTVRLNPKNRVWIILLILNFIQLFVLIPMPTSYYYLGRIWPATNIYCIWWTWFEYSSNAACLILMSFASVERYVFIFHSRFLTGTWWKTWLYHVGPVIICILCPSIWYMVSTIISPYCVNVWNFEQVLCGIPCFTTIHNGIYGVWNLVSNILTPICIIIITNITLILRVVYEKISRHQIFDWRRHRKMAFQLWFISSVYMAGWLPLTCTDLVRFTIDPTFMLVHLPTIYFTLYFIPLLLPIVFLCVFPETLSYTKEFFRLQTINRIVPTI